MITFTQKCSLGEEITKASLDSASNSQEINTTPFQSFAPITSPSVKFHAANHMHASSHRTTTYMRWVVIAMDSWVLTTQLNLRTPQSLSRKSLLMENVVSLWLLAVGINHSFALRMETHTPGVKVDMARLV